MTTGSREPFPARRVCIVGLGYIGLPTAAILASRGHHVLGVDIKSDVIETINSGRIHIVEPELDLLVKTAVESGRLRAATEPEPADVFIICVPTPFHHDTHKPDLRFVEAAAQSVAKKVLPGNLVILESTSPPGTTENIVGGALRAAGLNPGQDVNLAYCPERVLPGAILRECVENDRIIGGHTPQCTAAAIAFYETFVQGELLPTDPKTAETVKLVENASRDVQIAFANELSLLAERLGVDVWNVISLANRHPRVNVLMPGPGVGGHCIAVDPWFLADAASDVAALIRSARNRNDAMPAETARRILHAARERKAKCVALLGMAYKNDIDDCRESPSLQVVEELKRIAPELELLVCEPNVSRLDGVPLSSLDECIGKGDVIAILVAHREFRQYDWARLPAGKTLLDFKGLPATAGIRAAY